MARFSKAKPQQARLKVSIYGPPGSGKTFSTLLMAEGLAAHRKKRVAYVDTERGTDFYAQAVATRQVHPEAFDFDAIYTRSIADVNEAVRGLNPNEHGVVVLDSISHLWESAMDAYTGKKTKIDSIPMHAWARIKKPYKDLVSFLIGSPFDVFILGRQKNLFEDDENGEMKKVGVAMRAEGETAYEPHICIRMEAVKERHFAFIEKDRSGVLSGKTITNPDFTTIQPILPLLGETQAPAEDEDERVGKDAEHLAKLSQEKEEKSVALMTELQAKLLASKTSAELGAVADEIKKAQRRLMDEHQQTLRDLFKSRREIVEKAGA